ncbi:MAG TPA: RyR domain-containing protein [Solirubrobacteraceae bacterium]|nr:RyR domain-containing protein [Solirubrobacteraceae bacterium]
MTATATAAGGAAGSMVERVAQVVHEANRAWDQARGVPCGPPWENAPAWQREAALKDVRLAIAGAPPSQLHETWRAHKLAQGWTSGAVKDPTAKTDPMLVPFTDLSSQDRRTPELIAAVARTLACGHERWDVKTLTDPDAGTVILAPLTATIEELISLPAPIQPTSRIAQEFNTYQVTGTITMAKQEADSDIHMVITDAAGHTMIIEATCPDCAPHSIVRDQIATVRAVVEQQFPTAAAGQRQDASVEVTVTGVAFFDRLHGQEGVAPNGIELHPVLSFVVGAPTNTPPGPPAAAQPAPPPPAGGVPAVSPGQ